MKLLTFPKSAPLDGAAQHLFSLTARSTPPVVSDMSFAVLHAWQEHFGYRVSCFGDFIIVHYFEGQHAVLLPPYLLRGRIGDEGCRQRFAELMARISAWCAENGYTASLRYVPDQYAALYAKTGLVALHERDCDDYVYRRSDLSELPGREYAAKRNHIRRFERDLSWRYVPLGAENRRGIRDFMAQRAAHHGGGLASAEPRMIERLLDNRRLRLCGGALYVEGRIVAASAGTIIDDFAYDDGVFPTAVVHAEHADHSVPGASQMINRLFAAHLPPEVVYINREEDLGVPGLRKAKLSYYPCRMIRKFRIPLTQPAGNDLHPTVVGTGERT